MQLPCSLLQEFPAPKLFANTSIPFLCNHRGTSSKLFRNQKICQVVCRLRPIFRCTCERASCTARLFFLYQRSSDFLPCCQTILFFFSLELYWQTLRVPSSAKYNIELAKCRKSVP